MTRTLTLATAALGLLAGCGAQGVSSGGGDCTSHYEFVARAGTVRELRATLRDDVADNVTSVLRVADKGDKRVLNLLNAKRRVVMQVDVWQRADGTWVAGQWAQCTD